MLRRSDGDASSLQGLVMQLEDREIERMADMITPVLVNRIKATARILVGVRDIERMCGFGKNSSAVRSWIQDPTFPAPCRASRSRRWFLTDVLVWLKNVNQDKQHALSELVLESME